MENAQTPEELGVRFDPPLSKASVRATIRNAHRLAQGMSLPNDAFAKVDFTGYETQQAGRYHLTQDDFWALHSYLHPDSPIKSQAELDGIMVDHITPGPDADLQEFLHELDRPREN